MIPFQTTPPQALVDALLAAQRPLLIAHISPDGDAIGSLLAAGMILHRLGKTPILACQDRVQSNFAFLPWVDRITDTGRRLETDCLVALDASDPSRMGSIYDPKWHSGLPVLVIDHHITNTRFGTVNWIDPSASATVEMVFCLAQALGVVIDADIATCLLTGLITDTRGFQTPNTTARSLHLAAELVQAGAPLSQIMEQALNIRPLHLVQLWSRVLATVSLNDGIVDVVNTREMRGDLGNLVRAEGVVSFILGIPDAQIAAVFTELPDGQIECSFRARPGGDVATPALEWGGGGHPLASGCTLSGRLEEVRSRVLPRLRQANVRRPNAGGQPLPPR